MEDLEFECDAAGCETKIGKENGLCKYHIGRYLESKRPGSPVFLRKSQGHGTAGKPPCPSTGSGQTAKEAEMDCARCGKSSAMDKRFSKKKGLCNSCVTTIYQYKKAGKELSPVRGAKGTAATAGGTASLKEGKIYAEMKCKDCGRNKSEVKKFNKRTGQCSRCYQRDWVASKKAEKQPLAPELDENMTPARARYDKAMALARAELKGKGRGRKKAKVAGEQIPPGFPLKKGKREAPGSLELTLDFTGYERLLAIITAKAQDDFRTPGMQALFMLKEALSE